METHPYVGDDARSRARRTVSHLRALFKGVGRSPRPRQPGATGSNAYCLAQRCTTGSALSSSLPPSLPLPLPLSLGLMELAILDHALASCSRILTFTTGSSLVILHRRLADCKSNHGAGRAWRELPRAPLDRRSIIGSRATRAAL